MAVLYGRAQEIAAVDRVLKRAGSGSPQVLVVRGEPGIGKTRLLDAAVRQAAERSCTIFRGAAELVERDRPFAAIGHVLGLTGNGATAAADLAGGRRAVIAKLLAAAERPAEQAHWVDPGFDSGFAVIDAIVDLVEEVAAAGPVLLAVDDLQWADRSSCHVLAALQRRLSGLPLAIMTMIRTGDDPRHVREMLDRWAADSTELPLGALPTESIRAIARDLVGGGSVGSELAAQLNRAGGNPFFATELVRALRAEGLLEVRDGRVESVGTAMPRGLMHTVLRRVRLLPAETVELLQLASILGQSFAVADLALLGDRTVVDVLRQLGPALVHTVRESGDLLAFSHPVTWEAVYHDLPAAARRALHRHAAEELSAAGVQPARVARHYMHGAEQGDVTAVEWLRQAARGTAASSPMAAAELLSDAVRLCPEGPLREALTAELVPLLVVVGRADEAAALTTGALGRKADPGVEARLRVGLTHVLMRSGRVDDAREQVDRLLEVLPAPARVLTNGVASYVHLASGDVDTAEPMAEQSLAAAEQIGNEVVTATALMTLTWTNTARGRIDEAIAAGRRAVAVADATSAPFSGLLFPHSPLGAALLQADDFAAAEAAFTAGLARADRTSAPGTIVYHHAGLAAVKFATGEWGDACSEAEVALDLAGPTGTSWALLPSAVLARVAVARDDLPTAQAALVAAEATPEASNRTMITEWLHWAQAMCRQADGEPQAALDAVAAAVRSTPGPLDLIGNRVLAVDLVRIAVDAGERGLAEELAAALVRPHAEPPVPSSEALTLHVRGLIDGDADAIATAADLLHGSRRRYQHAMACEDAAGLLRTGDRARTLFRQALTLYRELDADRDVARASATMRANGMRAAGARRGRERGLTRTEQSVARLVAEGLSNPQIAQRLFISRHTAETHLKHIFAKLGLRSRAELAAVVAKQGVHSGEPNT